MFATRIEFLLQDIRSISESNYLIVEAVRKIVLGLGVDVAEEVKYGGIMFSDGRPFAGVFSYGKHVSVEFSNGATFSDEYLVLEGRGKLRRHLKLYGMSDMESKHLQHYLVIAHADAITGKSVI